MRKIIQTLPHLNGNLPVVVDVEATGTRPGYHEICQIAIVPLDIEWCPSIDVPSFYINVRPDHPNRMDPGATQVHGLSWDVLKNAPTQDMVREAVLDWFESLNLPLNRRLIPIAHNWSFETRFLEAFLGTEFTEVFNTLARDTMVIGAYLNDHQAQRGEPLLFDSLTLGAMCSRFGIRLDDAHDAYADCVAEAELYRNLMNIRVI